MLQRGALAGALIVALAMGLGAAAGVPDERAIPGHVEQKDIEDGLWNFAQLKEAGRRLFSAQFTVLDGAGRPGATGNGSPTRRPLNTAPLFLRSAGPDASSCAGCHNNPEPGGAGEFVANVFVGAQSREPVLLSVDPKLVTERGTPEMHGSGAVEMLAREMTGDLHAVREAAIDRARQSGSPVRLELNAKGVSFGYVTGLPDGNVRLNEIEGVDKDLVIRPWSQKGVVTSLRTFTVTAANQHHGMEAVERFGLSMTGTRDFDRDGVPDELTAGDVTALVVFQASLAAPIRVQSREAKTQEAARRGEILFTSLGCETCHRSKLHLKLPHFSEPGPYNLEGTLRLNEVSKPFTFDLTADAHLARSVDGGVDVPLYSDLKRHRICDAERPFFCNENIVQGFASVDQFITRRLWAAGNTGPYGHRGDLTTLNEAILHHGGEARASRLDYERLADEDRAAIISFLRSMQIVPDYRALDKAQTERMDLPYATQSPASASH
jgi:hypothetical protein